MLFLKQRQKIRREVLTTISQAMLEDHPLTSRHYMAADSCRDVSRSLELALTQSLYRHYDPEATQQASLPAS